MIIDYDRNPQLSVDRKLTSLCDSIQRAINELQQDLNEIHKSVQKLENQQKEINNVIQQNNLGE